jgi:hypothetical protein
MTCVCFQFKPKNKNGFTRYPLPGAFDYFSYVRRVAGWLYNVNERCEVEDERRVNDFILSNLELLPILDAEIRSWNEKFGTRQTIKLGMMSADQGGNELMSFKIDLPESIENTDEFLYLAPIIVFSSYFLGKPIRYCKISTVELCRRIELP